MMTVDWWKWRCARCGWKALAARTVNPQQVIAETAVRIHIASHDQPPSSDAVDPHAGSTGTPSTREKELEASLLRMTEERDRLQARLDGWDYTDAKALRAEVARLTEAHERLRTKMRRYVDLDSMDDYDALIERVQGWLSDLDALLAPPEEKKDDE